MDNVENGQNVETTQVENQGGPKIPGLGAPLSAPNTQGVQDAQTPTQQQQGKDSPEPAKIPLDIEALKEALDKGGDSAKEQPQELELPSYTSIPEYRWSDADGRIYQLDHQGRGIYALRIVG